MIDYQFVATVDPTLFQNDCQGWCEAGYTPYGDPFIRPGFEDPNTVYLPLYCQAFIKSKEKK